jgi:hypothetical protein
VYALARPCAPTHPRTPARPQWEERKAPEVLIRAYLSEFHPQADDALLVILTSAYHE